MTQTAAHQTATSQTAPAEGTVKRGWEAVKGIACAIAALFLPTANPRVDVAKLAIAGLLSVGFFLFTAPYDFPGGGDHFTAWAEALAHGTKLPPQMAQRDVGFPLLILLSGYTVNGSLIGITLIHALFAILMPILLYLALYRLSPPVAFLSGVFAIVSFAPVFFLKWIHHDQTYIFCTVLSITLLACYVQTRRPHYLYLFTLAIVAASISRPAGNILFPVFLVITYLMVRGRLVHYTACIAIFATVTALYFWHRHDVFDMAKQPSIPSYTGQQIFYNVYMNSADYGVPLSPAPGPAMAAITASLTGALQPSLAESKIIRDLAALEAPGFMDRYVYPYTPEELIEQVFKFPNWEYYLLLCSVEPDDRIYALASWDVLKANPWYIFRYTARNTALMLGKPGYAHTRHGDGSFRQIGNQLPAMAGAIDPEGAGRISPRAEREVKFLPVVVQRRSLPLLMSQIDQYWGESYQAMVRVTLALMTVAWLAVALLGVLRLRRSAPRGAELIKALSQDGLAASILAASVLLFYNIVVTAAFADPDFRYHHFIVLLRILVAGYGLIVVLRLFRTWRIGRGSGPALVNGGPLHESITAVARHDPLARLDARYPHAMIIAVAILTVALFAAWARFMVVHTW